MKTQRDMDPVNKIIKFYYLYLLQKKTENQNNPNR